MSEQLLLDVEPLKSKKKAAAKKAGAPAAKKAAAKKTARAKTAAVEPVVAEASVPAPAPIPAPAPAPAAPEMAEAAAPAVKRGRGAKARAGTEDGEKEIKPTRKTSMVKKAAEMLAKMQQQQQEKPVEAAPKAEAAPVAAPAPVPAPAPAVVAVEAPVVIPVAHVAAAPAAPVNVEAPPAALVAAPAAAPVHAQPPAYAAPQSPPPNGEGGFTPQERKKSKFERWKERRERFRQEKLARQQAGGGGQGQAYGHPQEQGRGHEHGRGQHPHRPQHGAEAQSGGDDERGRPPEVPLGPPEPADGILEMTPKGYGFLRQRDRAFAQHPQDAFIAPEFIRQFSLREGMQVKGVAQRGQRGPQITSVTEVNGRAPEAMRDLPLFEELKAVNPCKKIQFETVKERFTTRVIDMFTPVGRGQRGLIVAPPRAGKTTLLQHIAEAVVQNHPAMHLMILLVDERPEEVTEFKRALPNVEIYASSNDQDVKSHTRIAAFAIERAKRLVECGEHVFILMDSITRLARAFNNAKSGGATGSGGLGVGAMEIPRRLFAAARNTRQAGSLTILATALVETGSRMDEVIFQEFKGTGNMELVLDRKIAEQFYYPAVNIFKSGTRREELLLQPFQLDKIHMLRRGLAGHKPIDAIQRVLTLMERYPSNAQMLVDLPSKGA